MDSIALRSIPWFPMDSATFWSGLRSKRYSGGLRGIPMSSDGIPKEFREDSEGFREDSDAFREDSMGL